MDLPAIGVVEYTTTQIRIMASSCQTDRKREIVPARLELGRNAIDYLRMNLIRWGGMYKSIGDRDLESGYVSAYFPRPISVPHPLNLEEGLFNMEERMGHEGDWSSKDEPSLWVRNYLAGGAQRVAILHRPSLAPGLSYSVSPGERSGVVKRTTSDRSDFPTEIYQYLTGGDISIADIDSFIKTGEFWSMTCALTSTDEQLTSGMEVDSEFVLDCAARTQHILMNACDGDITLLWSATKASQQELE